MGLGVLLVCPDHHCVRGQDWICRDPLGGQAIEIVMEHLSWKPKVERTDGKLQSERKQGCVGGQGEGELQHRELSFGVTRGVRVVAISCRGQLPQRHGPAGLAVLPGALSVSVPGVSTTQPDTGQPMLLSVPVAGPSGYMCGECFLSQTAT